MPSTSQQTVFANEGSSRNTSPAPLSAPGRASRINPLPKWRLQRVQTLVELRISEPLRLADLAQAAGVSRMHFAAQFRAATGLRPHAYLLTCRVLRAMVEMAGGETPLAQLALAVGFQSQSHFSTVFKRLTGTTPAAWRNGCGTPTPFPTLLATKDEQLRAYGETGFALWTTVCGTE